MCASEMAAETSAEKILVRSAAARGHVGVLSKEGSRSGYRDTDSRENMLMSRVASTAMSIAVSFFFFFFFHVIYHADIVSTRVHTSGKTPL